MTLETNCLYSCCFRTALTRNAWLVDKAVILIPAIRARSAISRIRLVIKMAFLFVVVLIQRAQVFGVRMVSAFYFWIVCVWIFFFCGVAGDTAKQQRPFEVAYSL